MVHHGDQGGSFSVVVAAVVVNVLSIVVLRRGSRLFARWVCFLSCNLVAKMALASNEKFV